jgi:hypothetical protein
MQWNDALKHHAEAAAELLRGAGSVAPERWSEPLGTGKWTPAQVVQHLILAYEAMLQELSGGPGMRVRTGRWQRLVLRWTVLPRLLRSGEFPRARAPRETVPADSPADQGETLEAFRRRAAEFAEAVRIARGRGRRATLVHAYFGPMSLRDVVVLCGWHLLHHRRQLP